MMLISQGVCKINCGQTDGQIDMHSLCLAVGDEKRLPMSSILCWSSKKKPPTAILEISFVCLCKLGPDESAAPASVCESSKEEEDKETEVVCSAYNYMFLLLLYVYRYVCLVLQTQDIFFISGSHITI